MSLSLVKEGEGTSSTLSLSESTGVSILSEGRGRDKQYFITCRNSNSAFSDQDKAGHLAPHRMYHSAEELLDTAELDVQNNLSVMTNHCTGKVVLTAGDSSY